MKRTKLFIAFLSLLLLMGSLNISFGSSPKENSLRRGETRQTVDPALFSDPEIKAAYKVAREIPSVLDSIYCFCQCEESPMFRHKSLLSCYVDDHAAQ